MRVSENLRNKVLEILISLLEPTKAQEGCLCIELYENLQENGSLMLSQQWSDRITLSRHIRGNRFRSLLVAVDLLSEPPQFILSYINHELELEDIHDLMNFFGHLDHT